MRRRRSIAHLLVLYVRRVVGIIRRSISEHLIKDRAKRIKVAAMIECRSGRQLRARILCLVVLRATRSLCLSPKAGDCDPTVGFDEDGFRVEPQVKHTNLMSVIKRTCDLVCDL